MRNSLLRGDLDLVDGHEQARTATESPAGRCLWWRGVGEGFGGDFEEGSAGLVSNPSVVVTCIQVLNQAWHCASGAASVVSQRTQCSHLHIAVRGFEKIEKAWDNSIWIELHYVPKGDSGMVHHPFVPVIQASQEEWDGWPGVGPKSTDSHCCRLAGPFVIAGQSRDQGWTRLDPDVSQGSCRVPARPTLGCVVQDAGKFRDRGPRSIPEDGVGVASANSAEFLSVPGLIDTLIIRWRPLILNPVQQVWESVRPDVPNGFLEVHFVLCRWSLLSVAEGDGRVLSEPSAQILAFEGRLAMAGEEDGERNKHTAGEHDLNGSALWHGGSMGNGPGKASSMGQGTTGTDRTKEGNE